MAPSRQKQIKIRLSDGQALLFTSSSLEGLLSAVRILYKKVSGIIDPTTKSLMAFDSLIEHKTYDIFVADGVLWDQDCELHGVEHRVPSFRENDTVIDTKKRERHMEQRDSVEDSGTQESGELQDHLIPSPSENELKAEGPKPEAQIGKRTETCLREQTVERPIGIRRKTHSRMEKKSKETPEKTQEVQEKKNETQAPQSKKEKEENEPKTKGPKREAQIEKRAETRVRKRKVPGRIGFRKKGKSKKKKEPGEKRQEVQEKKNEPQPRNFKSNANDELSPLDESGIDLEETEEKRKIKNQKRRARRHGTFLKTAQCEACVHSRGHGKCDRKRPCSRCQDRDSECVYSWKNWRYARSLSSSETLL